MRRTPWTFFLVLALPWALSFAGPQPPQTRSEVEQLLAGQLPSGASPVTVSRFLEARGATHDAVQSSGPGASLMGIFHAVSSPPAAGRVDLQVRFSFLQDRLIGYSFAELPVRR